MIRMGKWAKDKNCMKDQRGFTLVELLIGIVILSIVTAAVCSFIIIGSKSYAAANTEIMLQQEAQLAMNQISDVVIDTTRSVNYAGFSSPEDGGYKEMVVKDADFTFEPQYKSLALFNGTGSIKYDEAGNPIPVLDEMGNPKVDSKGNPVYEMNIETGSGNQKNYQFYWDKPNEILYYSETGDVTEKKFPGIGEADCVVLAEYVTEFSVDLTQVEEKRVVQISMTFERDNKTYHTSNNITIRNKVRINEVDLKPLDKWVDLDVKAKESVVILEPGETYHFSTPLVTGQNIMDKSVTWSVSTAEPPTKQETDFKEPSNGIIYIHPDETATSFKVVIESNMKDFKGNPMDTDEVIVYVKRAKSVTLHKSEDEDAENGSNEVSAGKTFTISATTEGNKLGVSCDECGAPTVKDKYVVANEYPAYSWQIIRGADIVTMELSDNKSATFRVSSEAKKGDEIEIQAASILSVEKAYPVVYGTIVLKVAERNIDIHWSGNFKYGDEPLTLAWDYSSHYSLICVRIKTDDPNAPMANDKVMIYDSDGKAIRVGADLFGLNLDHDYYISIQVLDYALDKNAPDYAARRDEIVAEYNGNLDSTGTYIGAIPSSSKVTVPLLHPQFTISYNGEKYEGKQVDIKTISALSPSYVSCPLIAISNTRAEGERVLNDSKCNVYTGTGTDISGWTPLYTYQEWSGYTGTGSVGGLQFANCSVHNAKQLCINIDTNNNGAMNAIGSYHYVPFFTYSNAMDAQRYNVHWHNYEPDYDTHYYYRPESAINFEIVGKGSMNLWAFTTSNNFVKGEIYFPLPSESKFAEYFTLQDTTLQEKVKRWDGDIKFQMLGADGGRYDAEFSKMTCQYYAIEDVYEIELFYRFKAPVWEQNLEKSAGRFRCSANGTEWNCINVGALDSQFNASGLNTIPLYNGPVQIDGSNVSFAIKDNNGNQQNVKAYIPMPADDAFTGHGYGKFGFTPQYADGVQTASGNGIGFKYQIIGTTNTSWHDCKQILCSYDKNTDTYTLELTTIVSWKWDGSINQNVPDVVDTIKVSCKSTDTMWSVIK